MAAPKTSELSVGSFQVGAKLGSGATATVWQARNTHGQDVALKIANGRGAATQLAAEALHASLAVSPRLPELVDVGVLERDGDVTHPATTGSPFVALKLVEGRPVDNSDTAPSPLQLARDIAEALADLHDVGIAHGDVKPANIMTANDGRCHLIDLGLAGPVYSTRVVGATPRYLARGDRSVGDARARDVLALGLVVAELASEEVRAAAQPLDVARRISLPTDIAGLCAAMLAPEPGARPSAHWVCERASTLFASPSSDEVSARRQRRVRAPYLRVRMQEVTRAHGVDGPVAPWLLPAVEAACRARAMCRACDAPLPESLAAQSDITLEAMDVEQRRRWLVSLAGSGATSWPLRQMAHAHEPHFARSLAALAQRKRPAVWTLANVEAALTDEEPSDDRGDEQPTGQIDAARATELSLRLSRTPLDVRAAETVELLADEAPLALVVAAADALRLAGQLGRARSLVLGRPGGGVVAADVLRRAGDIDLAADTARAALRDDPAGRARATLARIAYDRGELDSAAELVGTRPQHAATAEVAALVAAAHGREADAIRHAERGAALALTSEDSARMAATIAYVKKAADPAGAREGYRIAVEHAVRAGAVLEEASYRTGEAAACVDLGELEHAVGTARRAALLWDEVLGQPNMAARAWLARAAAYAEIGSTHEACHAADHARERARSSDDARAEAYALWTIADAHDATSPRAIEAALEAMKLLDDSDHDDAVRAAARVQRHAPAALEEGLRRSFDQRCQNATASVRPLARLVWWAARANRLGATSLDGPERNDARMVLRELASLANDPAPVPNRGKAMFEACRLAAALGDTDTMARVEAARRQAARVVAQNTMTSLAEAARSCAWLHRHGADPPHMVTDQSVDLQLLVRQLSERSDLAALLARVVDVLLLWTGAERGQLLLLDDDGDLVVHAARNVSRDDLHDEQLAVSTSLAQQAITNGEPVVAIDAMAELSSSYDSVHALKLRSVLVIPLVAGGDTLGALYLDDRLRRGAFGDQETAWVRAVAPVAALAIQDARTQAALRDAVQRAEDASRKLEKALAHKEAALDLAQSELARTTNTRQARFADIIGDSEPMQRLIHLVERVAKSDVPVLLFGESGSGKELVAHAIHRASRRSNQPFVGESCGALPETLLESTLFGHVKGAFTGAHRTRIGLFEAAHEGTLFLDEVGEMSLGMQTKLLRVLEDEMVRPVGAVQPRKVDVRIVAATHRDLEQMVSDGTFREDLYYRLNVITVTVPPLRERQGDVPLLVDHLLRKHAPDRLLKVSRAAMTTLSHHPWPGNVRQLENEVRRALVLADDVIDTTHLSVTRDADNSVADLGLDLRAHVDQLEVALVKKALGQTGGNQTRAAKLLGVSRYGLHKMIKRLGITK